MLVVDDEEPLVALVSAVFASEGFAVLTARSGEECLQIVERDRPDAILLDIMMPEMDGWEVFRQIRASPVVGATPILILTARTTAIDREMGLGIVQADDYVTKPFQPGDLVRRVREAIARRRGGSPGRPR